MTDLYTSIVRTVVPALVGLVLGLGAAAGLDLDSAQVTAALTVGVYLAYYSVLRTVETWATTRGITWLATVAGTMLGWAVAPSYSGSS